VTDISTDILIIGAGPVGMTLALKLMRDEAPWRVLLLDRRERGSYAGDPRALALSHGTRQLLEPLGAWHATAGTPIHDIHVSQAGGFGRTLITREEQRVPALGYVMRYRDLGGALAGALPEAAILDRVDVDTITSDRDGPTLRAKRDGKSLSIRTQLVVHAEGTPAEEDDVFVADYHQTAVLAEVRPAPAHRNRAWERFTPDGPLALLPLGEDFSVVFTVPTEKSDGLMAMDDDAFLRALQFQFGNRITFTATSPRARYPLALRLRRQLHGTREIWIGNAAQTLHPVSGQGFNLGIRDAWELASRLAAQDGGTLGNAEELGRYASGRVLDRYGSALFTDGIVRGFSNDLPPLKLARSLGLMAFDALRPARNFVAGRMIWGARPF